MEAFKQLIAKYNNIHLNNDRPDVFLFSSPRSGSTWLTELILTQPGYKPSDEPFNLRTPAVGKFLAKLGINDWPDLYARDNRKIIDNYLKGIQQGKISITNPFFYKNHFRIITHNVIFKILHACEERINQIKNDFNGRVIFLIRHPIPVSQSRKELPRLKAFISSDFRETLSSEQISYAEKIIHSGSQIEKSMLDWCIQNAIPLKNTADDWIIITYEQLVLDPEPVIKRLTQELKLPYPELIRKQLNIASASTHQSDKTTQGILENREDGQSQTWLVEKWKKKITAEDESRLMSMLDIFEIDMYRAGKTVAIDKYWIK